AWAEFRPTGGRRSAHGAENASPHARMGGVSSHRWTKIRPWRREREPARPHGRSFALQVDEDPPMGSRPGGTSGRGSGGDAGPVGEGEAGDALVGLDIARPGGGDDVGGQRGRRRTL